MIAVRMIVSASLNGTGALLRHSYFPRHYPGKNEISIPSAPQTKPLLDNRPLLAAVNQGPERQTRCHPSDAGTVHPLVSLRQVQDSGFEDFGMRAEQHPLTLRPYGSSNLHVSGAAFRW